MRVLDVCRKQSLGVFWGTKCRVEVLKLGAVTVWILRPTSRARQEEGCWDVQLGA